MTTFNKIINKVVNLDNNHFAYNPSDNNQEFYNVFFISLFNNDVQKKYKNKFEFMEKTLNNFYFSKKLNEKNDFFNLFCKIQRIYHTLNRFIFLYKFKKSKLIVDTDLQLNKINQTEPNIICIYHMNSKYLFKIEELLKHIYTSLTNSFSFFSEPIPIRNPYNNLPFDKSILYFINSYFITNTNIKFINTKYIDVFFKFRDCDFNLSKFLNDYEYILREYIIQNYINNSTKESIINEIKTIIKSYNNKFSNEINKIVISEDFPKDTLIQIMKPYLYLKLQACYSLVQKNKVIAINNLIKKLREFQRFNPNFGRKIVKFKDIIKNGKIKRVKSHIEFVTKHKKFNDCEIDNFMNNHLYYNDAYDYDSDYDYEYGENDEETILISNTLVNTQTTNENERGHNEEDYDEEDYDGENYYEEYYDEEDYDEYGSENDSIS